MNKYLEKIAALQEKVDDELHANHIRYREIEEPINEMYSAFDDYEDDLYNEIHSRNPELNIARHLGVTELSKFYAESAMRRNLNTDGAHRDNSITTAQNLLALKKIQAELDERRANNVIRTLQNVKSGSNGYTTLRNAGTTLGAIGGTVGGGIAGMKYGGEVGGMLGLVGGGIVGGLAGHHGLNFLLKNKIQDRDSEIYDNRERDMHSAYERLRKTLER